MRATGKGRCRLVGAGTTLALLVLLSRLVPPLLATLEPGGHPRGFEQWLVAGCGGVGVLGLTWLWVLVLLVVGEATGTARRWPGVPPVVRRGVLAACGAGLAGGLLVPASVAGPAASPLDGLPLPDRPTSAPVRPWAVGAAQPAAASAPSPASPATQDPRSVVVSPGDTLWSLAAEDLPPGAPAAAVDAHWRAIHAANRRVVGDDPDLIRPGQRLRLPPAPSAR